MSPEPAYRIRSLVHAYSGRTVLDIPELDIPAGEICAVAGPNGSGKSTLLQILALLLTPVSGSVLLDGVESVRAAESLRLRRQVTLVHQKPVLFSSTVRNNISYGPRVTGRGRNGVRETVETMLDRLELTGVADRHARRLSGGEAQRVVLARALVLETPILLLDEPTSFLDDEILPLVLNLLRQANESRAATILIATHDLKCVASFAHRAVRLEAGRVAEVVTCANFPDTRTGGQDD
jgi:tungstate transport system ATP-binding protein